MYDLKGKTILIVGASSGIGEKTAFVLAEQGAKVILAARRTERLQSISRKIGADRAVWYAADASQSEQTARYAGQVPFP